MSYNDFEISNQDGRPITLYLLEWGRTRWRYTSADRPIQIYEMVDGVRTLVTYEPKAIRDNGMRQGVSSQNDFQIDGPSDLDIVRLFRGSPPSETIWVTVRRKHLEDDSTPIYWTGTVWNLTRPSPAKCQLICKSLMGSLKRTGLRLCWTRECPHFIYDSGCKVDPENFKVTSKAISFSGSTLVVKPDVMQDDGWFNGGIAAWSASVDGTVERRFVESAVTAGANLTLSIFGLVDFLKVGDTVSLYPGCSRIPEVCDGKFDNLDNYGGFDKMPGDTPFNTAIW